MYFFEGNFFLEVPLKMFEQIRIYRCVRTVPLLKVLVKFFQKLAGSRGGAHCRSPQRAESFTLRRRSRGQKERMRDGKNGKERLKSNKKRRI